MRKTMIFLPAAFLAGGLLAGEVSSTEYAWEADKQPASAYDGKVTFTYDANNKLNTIRVSEFPDSSKKLTFSGDPMSFKSGSDYVYTVPGEIVFANVVTGNTFFCYLQDQSIAKQTYGGGNTFLTTEWQTVLADASIKDWEVSPEKTQMSANGVSPTSGWSNPGNEMYACAVKRVGDKVTFQYQTDAFYSDTRQDWFSKCVKVELTDGSVGIQARANKTTYVLRSATKANVSHGYDIDSPAAGTTVETTGLFVQGNTSGYGVNIMKFIRMTPMATVRFPSPNGTKQIALISPQPYVNVVVEDASTMNASGAVYPRTYGRLSLRDGSLYWTGQANGGDGDIYFESTKAMAGEAGTIEAEDPYKTFSITAVTIATDRKLRDLLVCTNRAIVTSYPDNVTSKGGAGVDADRNFSWAQLNGSYLADKTASPTYNHERHPGNFYNLKYSDNTYTKATVQVQCQQSDMIRCFYLYLEQVGNDIKASALNKNAAFSINVRSNATKSASWLAGVGTDFDLIQSALNGKTSAEQKLYGYTKGITTWSGTDFATCDGIGVRDLTLVFKKPTYHLITSKNPCITAAGNYVVSGREDAPMALNILDPGGLPTNGTVTVKAGGELWFSNSMGGNGINDGVSKGTCALTVEAGGVVRQRGYYPFGEKQSITLDGGKIFFETPISGTTDCLSFFNRVTMMNGAELACPADYTLRIGNSGSDAEWTVGGTSPSTNSVTLTPLTGSSPYPVKNWILNVADTGDFAADFVQEGEIRSRATMASDEPARFANLHIQKKGAGTMLLNGVYSHPGLLEVSEGKFILGKSDIWTGSAPISLASGATLEAAAETSNTTLGALTVGDGGAVIVLGEGAAMTFADSTANVWTGRAYVTMPTNSAGEAMATLRFVNGVTDDQLTNIRINGKRADVTDDGKIVQWSRGMMLIVR